MVTLMNILGEIECDQYFPNSPFTVSTYDARQRCRSGQIQARIDEQHFLQWAAVLRGQLFVRHYSNFRLDQLKMIVIGSSGMNKYNSKLAFIAEDGIYNGQPANVPQEVHKFIDVLNESLNLKYERHATQYDYYCRHSKQSTLFMNVCLSTNESDHVSAVCSIRFLNKILQVSKQLGKQLAVIDLRKSKHIHQDNLLIAPEYVAHNYRMSISPCDNDFQTDSLFKLDHKGHLLVRLGKSVPNELDKSYMLTALLEMRNKGYGIHQLYMPLSNVTRSSSLSSETSNLSNLIGQNESIQSEEGSDTIAGSLSCANSLSSSFAEIKIDDASIEQQINVTSQLNTQEGFLVEQALQLSMVLPDDVKHFISELQQIVNDNNFLLYLWNDRNIGYGDETDSIINNIDDYLNSPYGVDLNQLDWVQYVVGFRSFVEESSSQTSNHKIIQQNSIDSDNVVINYDLTNQNYSSFIARNNESSVQSCKIDSNIVHEKITSTKTPSCFNFINNSNKSTINDCETKVYHSIAYQQAQSETNLVDEIPVSIKAQSNSINSTFKTDTNPFRIEGNQDIQYHQAESNLNIKIESIDFPVVSKVDNFYQLSAQTSNSAFHQKKESMTSEAPQHCIYLPKKDLNQKDDSLLTAEKCKPQFDKFIRSRLQKSKNQRNVHSLRLLLTLTAKHKWFLRQLKVNNQKEFIELLTSKEQFIQSTIDDNLYIRIDNENSKMFILLSSQCTEDALIISNDDSMQILLGKLVFHIESYSATIDKLEKCNFLGISIYFDSMQKCFLLNQTGSIEGIIRKYQITIPTDVSAKKPIASSIEALERDTSTTAKPVIQLIDDLLDISAKTRPDICAAVNILSRYKNKQSETLWKIALEIVQYLDATKTSNLVLKPLGSLNCFTDGSGINNNIGDTSENQSNRNTLKRNDSKRNSTKIIETIQQTFTIKQEVMGLSGSQEYGIGNLFEQQRQQQQSILSTENRSFILQNEKTEIDCAQQLLTDYGDGVDAINAFDDSDDDSVEVLEKFGPAPFEIVENDSPDDFIISFKEIDQTFPQEPLNSHSNPFYHNEPVVTNKSDYVNKSQTGYLLRSYQCPIHWASEHVQIEGIKDSDTVFIELIGTARSAAEIYLLKRQLAELGFGSSLERTEIFVDNQNVISKIEEIQRELIKNNCDKVPSLTKTIEKNTNTERKTELPQLEKYLHTLLYLEVKDIELTYVRSRCNTADYFTKVTTNVPYAKIRELVNVVDL